MKILYKISVLLIGLFWQLVSVGQTNASALLDSNSILVGDQVNLNLSFTCPSDYDVQWPILSDTIISEIEILQKSEIDTSFSDDNNQSVLRQTLKITGFDSGYYAIPPFRFKFKQPGDTALYFTETDALLLQVHTVQVDTTLAIKDIKAPIEAPYTFREALPWIIIFFAVLIIGYFVYYYLKKRKMDEPVFKAPPKLKLPPHQIALDALDNLRLKKLWQSGRIKDYHTELTDIIREYIFGKFNVHAMELTSDEINEAISSTLTNEGAKEKLRQTLLLADFVKFAKLQPTPLEHDASINNIVDFVKETIHINGNIVEEELKEIPKSSEGEQNKLTEAGPISVSTIQISERKEVNDV